MGHAPRGTQRDRKELVPAVTGQAQEAPWPREPKLDMWEDGEGCDLANGVARKETSVP